MIYKNEIKSFPLLKGARGILNDKKNQNKQSLL